MNDSNTEKKIRGDWSLINSQATDLYTTQDFFAFKADFLKEQLQEINSDVDFGIIEFKRTVLQNIFNFIDSLKYDSKDFDKIGARAANLRYLVYICLIQKFICSGSIRIRKIQTAQVAEEEDKIKDSQRQVAMETKTDFKTVIAEVSRMISEKPELKNNGFVKNILMQVNIYKKELGETQRLAANMPKDKAVGLLNNFKKRMSEIGDRASENFSKLQAELNPPPTKPAEGLVSYNLKPMVSLYDEQARAFSMLASRFSLVGEEHYGARDVLIPLLEKKKAYLALIDKELNAFAQIEPFDGGKRRAAMEFTREIVRNLHREAEEAFR